MRAAKPLLPAEQLYWERYLSGLSAADRPVDAFVAASYAGGRGATDFLIDLYLKGKKTAGSSLVKGILADGEPLPEVGNYWIVLDSRSEPRLLARTTRVETHLFKDMPAEVARAEGEGDLSLEHWRRVHQRAFGPYLASWGIHDIEEAEVVTEHFELLQTDLIRKPSPEEMETVYLMGFDAWGQGQRQEDYLKGCRLSAKYRSGSWRVLEDRDQFLASALLVHALSDGAGIGSIATEPVRRRRGSAAALIRGVLCELDRSGVERVYLHADIAPEYYERFGFRRLPDAFQSRPGSACMLRAPDPEAAISRPGFAPPPYF